MSYSVALTFEDDVTRFIRCNEDETVLDAAYRHKINLPMDCSDGVCGTCKGSCTSGAYDLGEEYIEEALSDDEKNKSIVLTCQMVPQSDCVISIPTDSSVCKTGAQNFQGSVETVNILSSTAVEINLSLSEDVHFLSGQYVNIGVPETTESRAYSFTSVPGSKQASFLIKNVPGGLMSAWLTEQAKKGDVLNLTGPLGVFYLRKVERPVLMLAGGTGLAPFLSMLQVLQENASDHPVHLVYGVTHYEDLVCVDELSAYAQAMPNFTFKTVVCSAESNHPLQGYVTDHMQDAPINNGDVDIYLCGPPPMVDAVMGYLDKQQIKPNAFHYERFTPNLINEAIAS
jgi:benzoate/toluate 1,2-dioxygenase reductase subunit